MAARFPLTCCVVYSLGVDRSTVDVACQLLSLSRSYIKHKLQTTATDSAGTYPCHPPPDSLTCVSFVYHTACLCIISVCQPPLSGLEIFMKETDN